MKKILFGIVILLSMLSLGHTETIYTTDGKTIKGKIVDITRNTIWYETSGGKVGLPRDSVSEILNDNGSVSRHSTFASDLNTITNENNAFALDLYAQLKEREGNLFFSPFSISTALAMTYAGARGKTESQMAEVLHFGLAQDKLHQTFSKLINSINAMSEGDNFQLSTANALWLQRDYDFLASFTDTVKSYYSAGLFEVDYNDPIAREEARYKINKWTEERTEGKIKNLITPNILNDMTRLVLTNAIYFKAKWLNRFNKGYTRDADFTLAAGQKIKTPMMYQKKAFNYTEGETLLVLELPYVGNDLSMVIFLPKEKDGLIELEKRLNSENVQNWLSKLRKELVKVSIPRFKTAATFKLSATLKSMGMVDAFTFNADFSGADFSGMDGTRLLYISNVLHKAFVDVNEEGTEAGAATAVVVRAGAAAPPPEMKYFSADHPFVFIIRENKSGSILFCGRITNPRE